MGRLPVAVGCATLDVGELLASGTLLNEQAADITEEESSAATSQVVARLYVVENMETLPCHVVKAGRC